MTETTTILVPIRYPLTEESTRTLAAASELARERTPAELLVLHVNLFQTNEDVRARQISGAISPIVDGVTAEVVTRRGFLVEEVILEEAEGLDADVVVVGVDRSALWRRLLRRMLGNDPAVGSYLRQNAADDVEVVEVDTAAEALHAES